MNLSHFISCVGGFVRLCGCMSAVRLCDSYFFGVCFCTGGCARADVTSFRLEAVNNNFLDVVASRPQVTRISVWNSVCRLFL